MYQVIYTDIGGYECYKTFKTKAEAEMYIDILVDRAIILGKDEAKIVFIKTRG